METVFISYCHKDEEWKNRLVTHLKVLEIEGFYQSWDDRQIDTALNRARVVVMLISADYLVSRFINDVEIPRILERKREEGVFILPVIVNPCPWQKVSWLSSIQVLPQDGKPLSTIKKPGKDQLLSEVAQQVCDWLGGMGVGGLRTEPVGPGAKVSLYKLPVTGERLFGREKELKQLDEAWADSKIRIVVLVAWGGVGKTALVNHWLNRLQAQDYRGARKVYGWSFYSQGAAEGKQASADEFFQETLEWFGDPQPGAGSAVEKERRLVRLVGQHKSLVILDGLEPLQYPPGEVQGMAGKLKDPGLAAFLKEMAVAQHGLAGNVVDLRNDKLNKSFLGVQGAIFQKSPLVAEGIKSTVLGSAGGGLCVITTRQSVADLVSRRGYAVKEILLEHLSEAAGVELLRYLGVTTGSVQDFRKAVKEYNGHALALTLLGILY